LGLPTRTSHSPLRISSTIPDLPPPTRLAADPHLRYRPRRSSPSSPRRTPRHRRGRGPGRGRRPLRRSHGRSLWPPCPQIPSAVPTKPWTHCGQRPISGWHHVGIKRGANDHWSLIFRPRFTCKSGEKKRADERTRTADLLITSWLAAILMRLSRYRSVAYLSRNLDHLSVAHPIAYQPISTWLQYSCSKLAALLLQLCPGL
jgi:hypothetical protein